MAELPSFPIQLCNWLTSISFRCIVVHERGAAVPVVEVSDGSRVLLKVIPVAFSDYPVTAADWEKADGKALLNQLTKLLETIRAENFTSIVLWEDYWIAKKNIVQSRLAAMLGFSAKIPARLTVARRIDNASATQFLDANHLNGNVMSKFRYGLFLPKRYYRVLPEGFALDHSADELLVAVATFSNARIFDQNGEPFRSHELIRFASLLGTSVVGALDKLLTAFIREKSPDDIMTYADLEWSDGRSYQRLGFEARGYMPPRAAYADGASMQRVRLPGKYPVESQTEADLLQQSRKDASPQKACNQSAVEYLTVYNLGSIKFVKDIKTSTNAS